MEEAVKMIKQGNKQALRELLVSRQVNITTMFRPYGELWSRTLLYHAVGEKQHDVIALLLELGARVNIGDEYGETPLHRAVEVDDKRAVSSLLAHGADVNAEDKYGATPLSLAQSAPVAQELINKGADLRHLDNFGFPMLHVPVVFNYWKIVRLLLHHGLNINHATKDGGNALHAVASSASLTSATVKRLMDMGAEINGRDVRGRTPLHEAVEKINHEGAESLLAAGADINAYDNNGRQVIHKVLCQIRENGISSNTIRLPQLLVSHGAKWDEQCENWLVNISTPSHEHRGEELRHRKLSHDAARAVRLGIQRWIEECENGLPPTDIPEEQIKQGFQATKTYLDQFKLSKRVILRRKICVVGPSNWGKTSLVKSLVSERPNLVHADDRTIGIDKFKLAFDQPMPGRESRVRHDVTFWDFAGQDEYQVAHSLFFSRRTLYLVCIDLSAYATTYYKAEIMTGGNPKALNERMNGFVETRILRWIRLILARQPDAEFQFIGTKNDVMQVVDADPLVDLKSRLADVLVIVRGIVAGEKTSITHLSDKRLVRMTGKTVVEMLIVSCTQYKLVDAALSEIKNLICSSERSYAMPDSYSAVLRIIKEKRKAAQTTTPSSRIDQCFIRVDSLTNELAGIVVGIDQSAGRDILRALRDIGDVLWYEDVDDPTLRDTVVLDPLLLIDLIRKIFNHKQKSEVLCHSQLQQLEVWKYIDEDEDLMLAIKRLLQKFHLAYPTDRDNQMQWDSDLMLPASWRTKTSAQLMFMGQPLRHPYGVTKPRYWQVDVHWVLEINSGFEEPLFDRLVVATYEPAFMPRQVGPDYILYGDPTSVESQYACRLVVDWHRVTHKRVLHLEAVLVQPATTSSTTEPAADLWDRFQCLCKGLAAVLATFPGLRVSSSARMGDEWPRLATCTRPVAKWSPPEPTLSECRGLLTQRRAAAMASISDPKATAATVVETAEPSGETHSEVVVVDTMASRVSERSETLRPPMEATGDDHATVEDSMASTAREPSETQRPRADATDDLFIEEETEWGDDLRTAYAILPVPVAIVAAVVLFRILRR